MIIFSQGLGLKTSSVCYELIIVINTIIVMIIIMTPEPSHQTHYDGIISYHMSTGEPAQTGSFRLISKYFCCHSVINYFRLMSFRQIKTI